MRNSQNFMHINDFLERVKFIEKNRFYSSLTNKFKKIRYFKFLFVILFFLSYYFYFLSLEKCYNGWDVCCVKVDWIKKKLIQALISIFILSFLIELIILKIISKYNLIHIFIIFTLFYKFSNGKDFNDHGYYNFFGCLIIFIIFFIGLFPLNLIIYFTKNKKCISFIFVILFLILYFFNWIINEKYMNCNDWAKGLNNTFIENNNKKYGCQIIFPKQCPYKIGKYFMDFTKLKGIKCENININGKQKIFEYSKSPYINKKTIRIGYPLTNKDDLCLYDYDETNSILKKFLYNNLVDMDNKTLINKINDEKYPEIEIDFSNNNFGKMNINLKFNKSLSNKKKEKENYLKPYSNNIMILYIDSVSRANSIRQLKKTLKFFEQFMFYKGNHNKKYPSENYHSFQFFKYHSFLYHTRDNYPLIFYGSRREEKTIILITKFLNENGYVTCYANDFCMKDNVRTFHNMSLSEVYDHQFMICDPNIVHYNQNSIKCLYGKNNADYLVEYGTQFWRKYKVNRKFLTIIMNDGHEGTLEALKYVDNILFNFLNNLYLDNSLKDSTIFLLSDHGVGMPSIYFFYKFYKLEEQLPMLYLIVNDRKNITYNQQYKNIFINQQTLITAYDIYNTIVHLIYGEKYYSLDNKKYNQNAAKSNLGESLFNRIDSKIRTTNDFKNMEHFVCI